MSNNATNCLPLASYTLAVFPGIPVAPIEQDFPVSVRITMAAIDPARIEGDEEEPATLRILKPAENFDDEDDEDDDEDEDDEDDEVSPEDMAQIKKLIAANEEGLDEVEGDDDEDDEDDEMEFEEDDEDDDDEDDDDEGEIEDFVVCTLSPKFGYQQTLDLVITPGEQIMFEVTGSYAIHLSGNYIEHPYDMEDEDELLALGEDSEDEDEDDLDEGEYDLSPDEDEIINGDERLVELMEQDDEDDEDDEPVVEPKKILKRAAEEKKQEKAAKKAKVAFTKELEQGPTPSEPKPKLVTRQLEGGVKIEDRTVGEGPSAKVGSKVGVRYVGKLANGKVFDSNSKGKPFYFSVGKGEVIRGWDIGVQGMKVKGERRIIIPPGMAYGKQKLPGIPPNSQLTFDVKVVNIK